jgi:hypothetical protein
LARRKNKQKPFIGKLLQQLCEKTQQQENERFLQRGIMDGGGVTSWQDQ